MRQVKFFVHITQVARSIYSKILFQTMNISKTGTKLLKEMERLSVSESKIFYKFLNFTGVFTNGQISNFPSLHKACGKVNTSLIHVTQITTQSFRRKLLSF